MIEILSSFIRENRERDIADVLYAYAREERASRARDSGRLRASVGLQLVEIRYRAGGRRVAIALRNAAPM